MSSSNRCPALVFFLLCFFVLFSGVREVKAQEPAISTISAEELKTKLAKNEPVLILDVRSAEGFASSTTTVKGAMHFKVRKLKSRLVYPPFKDLPREREIVTYCACPKDEASIAAAQISPISKRCGALRAGEGLSSQTF